jgi:hypothetical protein
MKDYTLNYLTLLNQHKNKKEMSVYIDNFNAGYGRMKMCHMVADTTSELLEMATKIGVQLKWIQEKGTYNEHFDICLSKKQKAIEIGAIEIGFRDYARFVNARANETNCDPKTLAWLRRDSK